MSVSSNEKLEFSHSNVSSSSVGSNNSGALSAKLSMGQRKSSTERSIFHTRMEDEDVRTVYHYADIIGEGSFGKVYKAQHVNTGETVAIKEIVKEKAGSQGLRQLDKEVLILKKVHHANIIHLREVIESSKKMYLIMELCSGGDLAKLLKKKGCFSEEEAKIVMSSLAEAIKYLHNLSILHRDLKLENILIAEEVEEIKDIKIKVSDFGLSTQNTNNSYENMQEQYCGTPSYMAPEMNSTYSYPVDVWAMGIIMYYLLTQYPKDNELNESISREGPSFTEPQWIAVSQQAKDLITAMLKKDPAYRLSSGEVLNHEWFTGKKRAHGNVLELMKEYGKEQREEVHRSSDVEVKSAIIKSEISPKTASSLQKQKAAEGSPKSKVKPLPTASTSSNKVPLKSVPFKKLSNSNSKNALTQKSKKL